ncbi:MAG: hypothetical protein ACI8WB_001041 [Phenylobacterium sp.]|jgi:hypothetical protein
MTNRIRLVGAGLTATLILCCSVLLSAQASEQDPVYYPERIQWHTIERLTDTADTLNATFDLGQLELKKGLSRAFFEWDQGRWLKLQLDSSDADLTVWFSGGDGFFQQMQPSRLNSNQLRNNQWLFSRLSPGQHRNRWLMMVEKTSEQPLDLTIIASKQHQAPALSVYSQPILHPDNQRQTNQSDGFVRQQYNHIRAHQSVDYMLEGPAEYSFTLRSQWRADDGATQLMELKLALDKTSPVHRMIKLQPQTRHLLQLNAEQQDNTADHRISRVYSRPSKTRLFVPEGTHTIKLTSDRDILGHWTRSNQAEQFFYDHNYSAKLASDVSAQQDFDPRALLPRDGAQVKRADYSFGASQSKDIPALYFYRELSPLAAATQRAIKPLLLTIKNQAKIGKKRQHWLPQGQYKGITSKNFSRLAGLGRADYQVPATSHQPPLQLYLQPFSGQSANLTLVSDNQETIQLRYWPQSNLLEDATLASQTQAQLHQRDNLTSDIHFATMQRIEFKQPFNQVSLINHSDSPIDTHLAYKNRSALKTSQPSFAAKVNINSAPAIIERLRVEIGSVLKAERAAPIANITQMGAQIEQWRQRLSTRYTDFIGQYPPKTRHEGGFLASNLKTVIANFSDNDDAVTNLFELTARLEKEGLAVQARKLLVAFAMLETSKLQQQAQQRFLAQMAAQERWFDIEGYWAYRFIRFGQTDALAALAQVAFRQNQFALANKWFWLAYQAQSISTVPDEAILAAYKAGGNSALKFWFAALEPERQQLWLCFEQHRECEHSAKSSKSVKLPQSWYYWQKLAPTEVINGRKALLHNRGMDLYFSAYALNAGQRQNFTVSGGQRLKVTVFASSVVNKSLQDDWPESDWLTVQIGKQKQQYLLSQLNDTLNLSSTANPDSRLASPKTFVIDLPEGEHQLGFTLAGQDALLTLHTESDIMGQWLEQTRLSMASAEAGKLSNQQVSAWLAAQLQQGLQPAIDLHFDQPALEHVIATTTDVAKWPRYGLNNHRLEASVSLNGEYAALDTSALMAKIDQFGIEQPEQLLLRLLQLPAAGVELIARVNGFMTNADINKETRQWLKILNRSYGWQRLQSVVSSAGKQSITWPIWQPTSPTLRFQHALLRQKVQPGERRLSAGRDEIIEIDNVVPRQLRLELRQIARLGEADTVAQVGVELDGRQQMLNVSAGKPLFYAVDLAPGRHKITLSYAQQAKRPWLFFALKDSLSPQHQQSVLPPLTTAYHSATKEQPLVVFVPAASWLRVDEVDDNGQLNSEFRYVAKQQSLRLAPADSASTSHFRLYHWQAKPETRADIKPKAKPDTPIIADLPVATQPTIKHTYWLPSLSASWQLYDKYQNDDQQKGTWGLFSGYSSRRNFDEDSNNTRDEQFFEQGWRYRRNMPDWNSYLRSDWSIRQHRKTSLSTLVSENAWLYRLSRYWAFDSRINGYYQFQAIQPEADGAISLYTSTSATWQQYWHDDVDNKLKLTAFARKMGFDEDAELIIDDDVYSNYKAQHRHGLRLSDTLQWTPWLDTKLRLSAGIASNENWRLSSPDKLSLTAGIRQYWRPLTLKFDLFYSHFRADKHRVNSSNRRKMRFDIKWEQWSRLGQLWQIDSYWQYDIDKSASDFGLMLSWDQSNGQGYDDFASSQLIFAPLRKRHSFHLIESNQVVDDSHD